MWSKKMIWFFNAYKLCNISKLYAIQSQVFEGTPEMHVSGVVVVSMCLDAVVNGCASAAPAAVGPMRFSLCRRVVYCYDGMVIQ